MKKLAILAILSVTWNCSGCTKYEWGNYDKCLLSHFKNPQVNKLETSLEKIAKKAEKSNRVPPGLYAELGFVEYELGKYEEAIRHFKQEKALWPESGLLMDKMILNAQTGGQSQL